MNLKMWLTLLLTGLSLFAQSSGGTLTGKVTDENGAALPNTVVIVVDTATNRAQRTVSGTDGSFSFANLSTGTYRVDIEGPSGTRTGQQTIQIASNQAANIEVVFGASAAGGGQAGAVAIKATTPMLQTETAEVARAYETRPIRSLPVLDREVEEFIGLMPGVTPPTADEDRLLNPQHRRTYNVNGLPDWANAAQQDGAYNTEPFQGKIARVAPNPSIQALNIRTSNYNANMASPAAPGPMWSLALVPTRFTAVSSNSTPMAFSPHAALSCPPTCPSPISPKISLADRWAVPPFLIVCSGSCLMKGASAVAAI